MYIVTCVIQGEELEIYNPLETELLLDSPVLDMEIGKAGSFSFSVPVTHPHREKIKPLSSEINVYRDGALIFSGRPLTNDEDFKRTGKINCEGDLAYLIDSIQRPYSYTGGITDFLTKCLTTHNEQVEDRKKIYVGNVTVVDSNDYINRSATDITNTFDTLTKKLIDTHGGYFRIRHSDGNRYLDYVTDYGGTNNQVIKFGENLVNMTQKVDPSTIITALIPLGADQGNGTKLDIKSVNGGLDYIYSPEGVAEFGWIWGTQRWDDVTVASNLLTKARAYLNECIALPKTLELKAVDLSLLDVSIEKLKLGYWTKVESAPHGVSAEFMLSKMKIDLSNPANNEITLGKTVATFTGTTGKQFASAVEKVSAGVSNIVNDKVQNATDLITGGKGGYIVIERSDNGNPEDILIMDAPSKTTAKNVIRLNKNGLGFSTNGIDGPYANAWTIDGNLIADFITSGTMEADRISGGTLEIGGTGTGKDGEILIKNSSGKVIGQLNKSGIKINNGEFSGSIEIGDVFTANSEGITLGDFEVSADESYNLRSLDGEIEIYTSDSPSGNGVAGIRVGDASIYGGAFMGGDVRCDRVLADEGGNYKSYFYEIQMGKSWWEDWTLTEVVQDLWEQVDDLSDERAKENINDIDADEARTFLLNSRPVVFQYKRDGKISAGFIAQEVDATMDELEIYFPLVGTDRKSGLYKVDYKAYIPLLVKAYQSLYAEVQALKSTLNNTTETGEEV